MRFKCFESVYTILQGDSFSPAVVTWTHGVQQKPIPCGLGTSLAIIVIHVGQYQTPHQDGAHHAGGSSHQPPPPPPRHQSLKSPPPPLHVHSGPSPPPPSHPSTTSTPPPSPPPPPSSPAAPRLVGHQVTITFDNLTVGTPVPTLYQGLMWTGWTVTSNNYGICAQNLDTDDIAAQPGFNFTPLSALFAANYRQIGAASARAYAVNEDADPTDPASYAYAPCSSSTNALCPPVNVTLPFGNITHMDIRESGSEDSSDTGSANLFSLTAIIYSYM